MLIYITFDDAVTTVNFDKYKILFLDPATQGGNPNGCPHRATFFVSDEYTDYELVQALHNASHEIASHTINHITMKSILKEEQRSEMAGQRDVIMEETGIPAYDNRGVRSPYLDIGGDRFAHDAPRSTGYCNNASQECPQSGHPLWQVPLNAYTVNSQVRCSMLDGCRPQNANETFDFLWENFQRHYNSPERPPFGLNLHCSWFVGWPHTLVGFQMFLEKLQGKRHHQLDQDTRRLVKSRHIPSLPMLTITNIIIITIPCVRGEEGHFSPNLRYLSPVMII